MLAIYRQTISWRNHDHALQLYLLFFHWLNTSTSSEMNVKGLLDSASSLMCVGVGWSYLRMPNYILVIWAFWRVCHWPDSHRLTPNSQLIISVYTCTYVKRAQDAITLSLFLRFNLWIKCVLQNKTKTKKSMHVLLVKYCFFMLYHPV